MPTIPLPENPSLEHLKSQAKLVQDLVRASDVGALSMVDEFHPRLSATELSADQRATFRRTDAQLTIARMYRFASWNKLREHLKVVKEFSYSPSAQDADRGDEEESFVALACLNYAGAGPALFDRLDRAHVMLAADPSLATGSVEALATVGDYRELARVLDRDPAAAKAECGPNAGPPLLYVTYSRISTGESRWSAVETAKVLLDGGADPNAGFLWRGLVPPFTALSGAFGGGEGGQPGHPDRLEIARVLLEAGADPNDGQTLYNNGLGGPNHDDPSHLELLLEFGLGTGQNGPWYRRLGSQLRDPQECLYDELEVAAARGRPKHLALLIDQGLDLDRPVGRSQKTPVRLAAEKGHVEILGLLGATGLDITLQPAEEFLGYVRAGDGPQLGGFLADQAALIGTLIEGHPGAIKNVTAGGAAVLTTLVEAGFDINARTGGSGTTALHDAAQADNAALARLLVEHGANPNLEDTSVGATPWGWADHFRSESTAAFLLPLTDRPPDAADQ